MRKRVEKKKFWRFLPCVTAGMNLFSMSGKEKALKERFGVRASGLCVYI